MLPPPHWLTRQSVDTIGMSLFAPLHQEFVSILEQEEKQSYEDSTMWFSKLMSQGWKTKVFWFSLALMSPAGLSQIFYNHIRSEVAGDNVDRGWFLTIIMHFRSQDIEAFIAKKLEDKAAYDKKLQEEFDIAPSA
ncbi:hypothetical protein ACJ73_02594 [Blastomyces percursus]|uniref:Uncharacterized protein n=1 Tax=Blastomyces percursus TaxID=1658174 RepID=A0A1J9QD56_9EURO|nr:hypothetical protein ACJ73_02594 [Blastomyces percursus]